MNYIKSFKLFESVDNILHSLDISSDELKDIFQDLIDEGFEYMIKDVYLTRGGTKYNPNELIDNYYPTLSITLKRDINNNDDIRNWDGSYYYEDKNIIEIIHHCINRLKSTLNDQDVKVLYSISNINLIDIRICISEKSPDVKLDINKIKEYLDNKFVLDFPNLISEFTEDYMQLPARYGVDSSIYIKPKNMSEICDRICKDEVKPNDSDKEYTNLKDFKQIISNVVTHLLDKFKDISKLKEWSLKDEYDSDWSVSSIDLESGDCNDIYIFYKEIPIIQVSYSIEGYASGRHKIKGRGLFKPSFYKSVKLYRLRIEVDVIQHTFR